MDYSGFQVEDFVADEHFIKWVKRPDAENSAFWNAWLSKNPWATERVRAARDIILQLDFKPNTPPEGKFLEVWDKIVKADGGVRAPYVAVAGSSPKTGRRRSIRFYWMAAAVALLIVSSYFIITSGTESVDISTTYGESRTLSLPDSTKVTLNSNSRISFSPDLLTSGNREVFLQGEAFFSVVHKVNNAPFVVHTGELRVEVLGTKFNVNSRRGNTKVILTEGKVKLNVVNDKTKADLIMQPGEYVELTQKGQLTRKTVDANNYLEWRNNRLIFVGTSLEEIGQILEDNYGYEVTFEGDSIKYRRFTGSSSAVEIEDLLEKLSRVYDLEVKQNGNKVMLKQK